MREQRTIRTDSLEVLMEAGLLDETADAALPADTVEQELFNQQLVDLLHRKLSNEVQHIVMIRLVLYGDQPRDVARDLHLPLHHTRLAKSRALGRLRDDEEFMRFCRSLLDDNAGAGDEEDNHGT